MDAAREFSRDRGFRGQGSETDLEAYTYIYVYIYMRIPKQD